MLGKIISQVVSSSPPVDNELTLVDPVSDPIKSHVNGLGTSLLDGVIGNARSTGIVSLDEGCLLGMACVFQGCPKHNTIFGIEKKGSQFGFSGGSQDGFDDGTVSVDCPIVGRRNGIWIRRAVGIFGLGTEKKCTSCSGPGLTF